MDEGSTQHHILAQAAVLLTCRGHPEPARLQGGLEAAQSTVSLEAVTVYSLSCSSRKWVKYKLLLFRNMLDQLIICAFYLGKKTEAKQKSLKLN